MVSNGADLQARDLQGKSVSDYCNTYKIYNVIRALGAPSTLFEENCIIGAYRLLGATAIIISAAIATICYQACFPQ